MHGQLLVAILMSATSDVLTWMGKGGDEKDTIGAAPTGILHGWLHAHKSMYNNGAKSVA
jgi:hypothetical protein